MLYIFLTLLSGIASGLLSIFFRTLELKKGIILMHKQFFIQMFLFFVVLLIFKKFFTGLEINFGFFKLGWAMIYVIFSSFSYYAVQVFYEFFSGNKLFPTEQEMKNYMEKIERERDNF